MRILLILLFAFVCQTARAQSNGQKRDTAVNRIGNASDAKIVSPSFPGGMRALTQFLTQNIRYPAKARLEQVQGKVVLQVTIEPNGKISDITVVSSPSPELSAEGVRVLKLSPKWVAGTTNGIATKMPINVPIMFGLVTPSPKDVGHP